MAEERKTSLTPEELRKTIFVEFVGGFRDGQILRSDSANHSEVQECFALYMINSHGGKIGKRIQGYSDAGIAELNELIENTPEGPRLKREPIMERNHIYVLLIGRKTISRFASGINTWERKVKCKVPSPTTKVPRQPSFTTVPATKSRSMRSSGS